MRCGAKFRRTLRLFLADERGTAGIEFLTASPLLFGVLIFTAEYGQALRYRIALDGAVQDIARYLARAPARATTDSAGNPSIAFYDQFLEQADAMLDSRVGRDVTFALSVRTVDTANFRTPFYVIEVTGSVALEMPLLALADFRFGGDRWSGVTLAAAQQARWEGGAPPGALHCAYRDRYSGTC